ncbi:reverse transcriptase domain-containing protein [Tanacetum coccineum]|uniref:Reverse transcriptase domain-containing protein n=1 Tax=Tanacetum coccineum TaxID=301880 RepID=A0ABQ5FY23_9ASTR
MMFEATRSKEINEIGINENKPPRFEQDMQEKPHDDALVQIPKYAKYLKSLLTNKSKLKEACTETINEQCSAVLLNKPPLKEKDPDNFTIPCQVLEKHKETKDLAADHSSRLENPHMEVLTEREIADKFSDEHLMALKPKSNNDEPWYADFVSYIVRKIVPPNWTFEKKKEVFCKSRLTSGRNLMHLNCGHHSANVTAKKIYESGFYWPSVFKDANKYVSKWVEAQALPTNDARVVVKFLRQLFARFGVPKA